MKGEKGVPQLVSGNNFTASCPKTSKEGVGGGSSGRREQGEALLWQEKKRGREVELEEENCPLKHSSSRPL